MHADVGEAGGRDAGTCSMVRSRYTTQDAQDALLARWLMPLMLWESHPAMAMLDKVPGIKTIEGVGTEVSRNETDWTKFKPEAIADVIRSERATFTKTVLDAAPEIDDMYQALTVISDVVRLPGVIRAIPRGRRGRSSRSKPGRARPARAAGNGQAAAEGGRGQAQRGPSHARHSERGAGAQAQSGGCGLGESGCGGGVFPSGLG